MPDKVKKRGWVKNAAIIFLAVMLVLTFFSDTIMNRSLPEVAAQYVSSGTITKKIRGTGTVKANSTYNVAIAETRTVKTVAVKVGDTVELGDVLFLLDPSESSSTDDLQSQLDSKKLEYQKKLIEAAGSQYSSQKQAVEKKQDDYDEAVEERDKLYITEGDVAAARQNVTICQQNADDMDDAIAQTKKQIESLQSDLTDLSTSGTDSTKLTKAQKAIDDAQAGLNEANDALNVAWLAYGTEYNNLVAQTQSNFGYSDDDHIAAEAEILRNANSSDAMVAAYDAIAAAQKAVTEAQDTLNSAQADYNDIYESVMSDQTIETRKEQLNNQIDQLNDELDNYDDQKKKYDDAVTKAEDSLKTMETQLSDYEQAVADVKTKREALDDSVLDLEKQQSLDSLDISDMKKEIKDLEDKIADADSETSGNEVTAGSAGVIKSINITAGEKTEYNGTMAVIEVTDRGYSLSFSVTNAQSQKVSIGDTAEVSNYYWGPEIEATLTSIRNDQDDPANKKLLVFTLSGDVSSGDSLTLAVGQKSATYNLVVPNNAIRTDSNGSFVYIVESKQSPLGNRYFASRADIQVLAEDDSNSAVSGGLADYDYVITTATAPIENGMQIRLAENS